VDDARVLSFGPFELDLGNSELRRAGVPVRLQPQPFKVLSLLVRNAGRVVSRDEIRADVWGPGTFLDFDQSLNFCIRQIRSALGDAVSAPTYIETRQRLGYRFIAPVAEAAVRPAPPDTDRIMLAVLPFLNLSGLEEQDYFSDGLTEEMTTQLSRLNPERLGVIARTSAMRFKGSAETVEEIGRQLHVNYVLEGSVRRAKSRVRIAAQLIDVSDQTHVWAESYERDVGDALALQSEVARVVAGEIQVKLGSKDRKRPIRARRIEARALDAYLKGRYFWSKRSRETLDKSISCFRTAIEEEPRYAEAYAGLADCYLRMLDFNYMRAPEAISHARTATDAALELDDSLAEAHTGLGHRAFHEFAWATAEKAFRAAIDLNPNYDVAHYYYGNFLAAMGRFPEAIYEAERTLEMDPVSPGTGVNLLFILHFAGRYDAAIAQSEKVLELDPGYGRAYYCVGLVYERLRQYDSAIEALRKGVTSVADGPGSRAALAHVYAMAGERRKAQAVVRELERIAGTAYVSPYDFALTSLALGDFDSAISWLARAYEARSSFMAFVRVDQRLAPLHSDHRFRELVRRMKFPDDGRT
jgi:TolB-like protein/Flp pilus assembly protein TadD